MFPGFATRLSSGQEGNATIASATTVSFPKSDLVIVTGTTTIVTINSPYPAWDLLFFVICTDGAVQFNTGGNIAKNLTIPQNQVTPVVYRKANTTWYVGAIS